jgi:hypothetical protein
MQGSKFITICFFIHPIQELILEELFLILLDLPTFRGQHFSMTSIKKINKELDFTWLLL